jgi:beta-glucanase (GH16 family)
MALRFARIKSNLTPPMFSVAFAFSVAVLGACSLFCPETARSLLRAWQGTQAANASKSQPNWKLSWQDEFNQPDGSRPDPTKWTYDLGGSGWGNHELESYTDRPQNAHIEKGNLVITAMRERHTDREGVTRDYTSARLKTQGLFAQAYGRFEARIKIPEGQGMWPAFWMMGDDISAVGWPKCGEIDIMENVGKEPGIVHGSLHGPERGPLPKDLMMPFSVPAGGRFSDDFHVYAIEWQPDAVRFYVDTSLYASFFPRASDGGPWVFAHPFFILLNVAVGGDWPGPPDDTTHFPQSMLVDYVRVYSQR